MQSDAPTPAAYLGALPPDWRRDTLLALRALVLAHAPELVEQMQYGMLGYGDARGWVFSLAAQKHHVSFYVGDAARVDPSGELLAGLDCGKGCIRWRKRTRVGETRIEAFIARAAALRREGGDPGC